MTVVKIGYHAFLVPDGVDAGPILDILSHSLPCEYYGFQPHKCVIEDKEVELKIHVLSKKCRIVRRMGEAEVDAFTKAKPKARSAKTLAMPPPLALENGGVKQLGNGAVKKLGNSQGTLFLEGPRE